MFIHIDAQIKSILFKEPINTKFKYYFDFGNLIGMKLAIIITEISATTFILTQLSKVS